MINIKKDLKWMMGERCCTIRNVPYKLIDDEPFYDLDVSIKIAAIRDLMHSKQIDCDVDFELIANLEF